MIIRDMKLDYRECDISLKHKWNENGGPWDPQQKFSTVSCF